MPFNFLCKIIKLKLATIGIVLFNIVSVVAQDKYAIPACSSSSMPRNYVGNKFFIFLPNNRDLLLLSFPRKSKFKRVQDIDYTEHFVGYGKKKNRVWLSGIFGPLASNGEIPKDWLSASVEMSQRRQLPELRALTQEVNSQTEIIGVTLVRLDKRLFITMYH
ncbi:MAG TPA: hypothetical protein VF556_14095 [Pyrinomonadaceae bacterium]|jgi:hypothetical protein